MRELKFKAIHPEFGVSEPFEMKDFGRVWFNTQKSAVIGCCITTPGLKFVQYIGIKYNNGAGIYEGDNISSHEGCGKVVWLDGVSRLGDPDDNWGSILGFAILHDELDENGYQKYSMITSDRKYYRL